MKRPQLPQNAISCIHNCVFSFFISSFHFCNEKKNEINARKNAVHRVYCLEWSKLHRYNSGKVYCALDYSRI